MSREERIRELVEMVMETGRSPAEVCAEYPDLLPEVRARWKQVRSLGAQMDVWFPSSDGKSQFGAAPPPPTPTKLPEIPGYEMESLLGHGGMGVVYRARHLKLNRRVAIKMMLAGIYADPVDMARFQKEAEAVASIRHPHIVQIHDLGDFKGSPFFTMELMEGRSLAQKISGTPQPVKECAETLATLAEAVSVAHGSGIIHRDLKPGNILFTLDGIPKITDFGLARRADDAHLTQTGKHVGTPSYMAPEQASGQFDTIDFRVDIYSLGAILYEMLTGRPPFSGRTPMETLSRALLVEPVRPSRLISHVPRDLETICLKCLEKNPDKRYATAADLAADLKRFLRNEPIRARPIGNAERTMRWMSRHKGLSAALVSVAILLIVLTVISLIAAAHFRAAEQKQAVLASQNRQLFEDEEKARIEEKKALDAATAAEKSAKAAQKLEAAANQQLRHNLYIAQMNLGGQALRSVSGMGRLSELITPWQTGHPDFRNWEWYYLNTLCNRDAMTLRGHTHGVRFVAWSPDGKQLASAERDGTIAIWNAPDGRQLFRCGGHTGDVPGLTWSPDSGKIASAGQDRSIRIWDAKTGQEIGTTIPALDSEPCSISWSPDGKQLAWSEKSGEITIWNLDDAKGRKLPHEHRSAAAFIAWSPRGGQLASAGEDTSVRVWDTSAGKQIGVLRGHIAAVTCVAWSHDAGSLASASMDGTARIWDVATKKERTVLYGHMQPVLAVAWSPDHSRLATAGFDQTVRLWGAAGRLLDTYRGHASRVTSVAWNPAGAQIVSASFDSTIKIWDADLGPEYATFIESSMPTSSLTWRGELLCSAHEGGTLKVYDVAERQERIAHRGNFPGAQFTVWSSDGRWCACAGKDGTIHVWDVLKNQPLGELRGHNGPLLALCASPEGDRLASSGSDRTIRIWNPIEAKLLRTCTPHTTLIRNLAWEPDGRWLAAGADDATLQIYNSFDGKVAFAFDKLQTTVIRSLAWNSDGKRIAVVGGDQAALILSLVDHDARLMLKGHTAMVNDVGWSPANDRLVTASDDKTMKIWDATTGRQLLTLEENRAVAYIAWSPDGFRIASIDSAGTIHVRDATQGYIAGAAPAYLTSLNRRIEATPKDASLWQLRANIHAHLGDWDNAAKDLDRYLALKPGEHWAIGGYWAVGTYPGDFTVRCAPESNPDPAKPVALFAEGGEAPKLIDWQRVPVTPSGFINFGSLFGSTDRLSAYALLRIYSPQARRAAILFGADDAIQLSLNGKNIYEGTTRRDTSDPTPAAVIIDLQAGWNTVLARVKNETGDHTLYLRLSDLQEDFAKAKSESTR